MIYIIVGPTCSGKTSIGIKLADKLNAPIINGDAFQIYQDMNIGTAKIEKDDPAYNKHYLLDIVKPDQTYSVKQYQDDFRKTMNKLMKAHEDVLVVGGTGLYIRAAIYDYIFNQEEETDTSELEKLDNETLYQRLVELDKEAASKIHLNNRKRLIRAISMIESSHLSKSELINSQEHKLIYPEDEVKIFFINPDRETLYKNINDRVDLMFKDDALINEVKSLKVKYELSLTAKQGIGYKEVLDYLDDKYSLEECKELIKKRTRNYAKRQVTFFKNQFKYQLFSSKYDLLKEFGL